jgi:hypothetical protein
MDLYNYVVMLGIVGKDGSWAEDVPSVCGVCVGALIK